MRNAINWMDYHFISPERTVLTNKELQIPGLSVFGKHTMVSAIAPLPLHYHKNCFEFTYVAKGVTSFSVNKTDYKLSGGDVFFTYPDESHSTNLTPLSSGELLWFQLDIKQEEEFLFLSSEAAESLILKLKQLSGHLVKTDSKEMLSLINKAYYQAHICKNKYKAASYITLFLYCLLDYANEIQFQLTPDIGKAINYILDNVTQEISLDTLADYCHLSTSQFKQKFKAEMGVAPRNFINLQKIEMAKLMLLDGISIIDIAMELGFNTSSYFSVVFKRYTTYSPLQYLRRKKMESEK